MGYAVVMTRAGQGIDAPQISVEVHLANGMPGFHLVGLAETAVKEARERVRGALLNSGFTFPAKRITVNLAPADIPKNGGRYDMAIAVGILAAEGFIPPEAIANIECIGELSLRGELRGVTGLLPAAQACEKAKNTLYIAEPNTNEAQLVNGLNFVAADSILTLFLHLTAQASLPVQTGCAPSHLDENNNIGWDDIVGQEQAKRALLIAASGKHHLLFVGPPGTGKSMLAHRLTQLLPPMSEEEALEAAAIRSIKGEALNTERWRQRPFRSPHHTSSAIALTGGGTVPKPGEISLAHHGVLFLDELPEFGRQTLDVLREPLETGDVCISRAAGQAKFPAQFQLVCALNPSPTGDVHDGRTPVDQILRYLQRLSGPLLDRIDIQVDVPKLADYVMPSSTPAQDSLLAVKQTVLATRAKQIARQGKPNGQLTGAEMAQHCQLSEEDSLFFKDAAHKLELSMRTFHRTLKVARTLADLSDCEVIQRQHLAEALGYRALDNLIHQLVSN